MYRNLKKKQEWTSTVIGIKNRENVSHSDKKMNEKCIGIQKKNKREQALRLG